MAKLAVISKTNQDERERGIKSSINKRKILEFTTGKAIMTANN